MARRQLVFGVDGGGTKSIGVAADQFGNILASREGGPTNPNVVGVEQAASSLFQLITECSADVGCDVREYRSIVAGLAGAGSESNRKQILDAVQHLAKAKEIPPLPIAIETDARVALEGAFDGKSGVVVIAGTGSIVVGKTPRGETIVAGGWGRIIGDEGSGYYIGREALSALALQYDKRGPATTLRDVFAKHFNWRTRDDIIASVYRDRFDIASLAPMVFETASGNDTVSQQILQRGATHLAEQIRVIVLQMGILRKVGLVMCGSLVDHETVYANLLHMKLLKLLPQVEIRQALHSPAHGAVLMALERLKKI